MYNISNTYKEYNKEELIEQINDIFNISIDYEDKNKVELINKLELINQICEFGIKNIEVQ